MKRLSEFYKMNKINILNFIHEKKTNFQHFLYPIVERIEKDKNINNEIKILIKTQYKKLSTIESKDFLLYLQKAKYYNKIKPIINILKEQETTDDEKIFLRYYIEIYEQIKPIITSDEKNKLIRYLEMFEEVI